MGVMIPRQTRPISLLRNKKFWRGEGGGEVVMGMGMGMGLGLGYIIIA